MLEFITRTFWQLLGCFEAFLCLIYRLCEVGSGAEYNIVGHIRAEVGAYCCAVVILL
jgi:hypothetical protein